MNKRFPSKLWLRFTGLVFSTIFFVSLFVILLWYILHTLNVVEMNPFNRHIPPIILALDSLLLGTVITVYIGKLIVRPIQNICNAFNELSKGNFAVKVSEDEQITEIKEMAERFNAMTYDLSHIETLRSDFVSNVSHEFKTPIAAIEGYATLLQNDTLSPEKQSHYVKKILDNACRLSSLSGNILMLSKLENQEMVLDQTEYRLDEQIRRCILILEKQWTDKNIAFDMDLPRQKYFGSAPLLEQVWSNLIDNAIKHSPAGGNIRIAIYEAPKSITVTISDDGDGMTEHIQKHIFEKFYQGDNSREAEGNGLGLALVKRITVLCKASVQVESAPGKGATFSVKLPKQV